MTNIKTANEILKTHVLTPEPDYIINAMKEYANQFIDLAAYMYNDISDIEESILKIKNQIK